MANKWLAVVKVTAPDSWGATQVWGEVNALLDLQPFSDAKIGKLQVALIIEPETDKG